MSTVFKRVPLDRIDQQMYCALLERAAGSLTRDDLRVTTQQWDYGDDERPSVVFSFHDLHYREFVPPEMNAPGTPLERRVAIMHQMIEEALARFRQALRRRAEGKTFFSNE